MEICGYLEIFSFELLLRLDLSSGGLLLEFGLFGSELLFKLGLFGCSLQAFEIPWLKHSSFLRDASFTASEPVMKLSHFSILAYLHHNNGKAEGVSALIGKA